MPDLTVQWTYGRFESLVNGANQTLLVFKKSDNLLPGDVVTFEEVDESSAATGRVCIGTVSKVMGGEFYNLPKSDILLYFNPMQRMPWIDISSTSTVTGWSAFLTKLIQYQVIGDTVIVKFDIRGLSNSTVATFTVPIAQVGNGMTTNGYMQLSNSGTPSNICGRASLASGSTLIRLFRDWTGLAWTASGNKVCVGEIIYRWR
jgi:hypothetical protein